MLVIEGLPVLMFNCANWVWPQLRSKGVVGTGFRRKFPQVSTNSLLTKCISLQWQIALMKLATCKNKYIVFRINSMVSIVEWSTRNVLNNHFQENNV